MKRILSFLLLFSISYLSFSQSTGWKVNPLDERFFIQNVGQFDNYSNEKVHFVYDGPTEKYIFTDKGVIIKIEPRTKRVKSAEEKAKRKEWKEGGFKDRADFINFEMEGNRVDVSSDILEAFWWGSNSDMSIVAEEKNSYYHNYGYFGENGEEKSAEKITSYKKIVYKNVYPNIDVVYEFHPLGGLKYSLVIRPGGDVSNIKLHYSKPITLGADGTIRTPTIFGEIIDHTPLTFYGNNKTSVIDSKYSIENNVISFSLGNYDKTKTITIDPWTQTPNFPSTNWDSVWECERDGVGNVYIIGGTSPLQLIKYNAAGAIQWTVNTPYDTTEWLGTFAVDNAGNSYVANGSTARIIKYNTAGGTVWNNPNPGGIFTSTEFWNITFNCDETKLVIGGTGGFLPPLPYIYDVDLNSGNITASVQVHDGPLIPTQEVRAITPCNNAKYYYLTHDSIGYVHQSLNTCNTSSGYPFHVDNGISFGYKAENWRYNNSGIMALAHYNGFVFVHRGNQLQKRDFNTAAIVATATIPGGQFNTGFGGNNVGCSGIDIDDCGNIYVGSTNGVYKFDQSLTQTGSFATTFNVYDVEVSTAGDIIACGSTGTSSSSSRTGSIQSFAATACAPQAIICCDATICNLDPVCTTDAPFTPTTFTSGGTWSASCGSCINATTGLFDPAAAGQGTFTITYTIACGSESQEVVVNTCTALDVCLETNGDFTVSGGTGPYTWSEWQNATSTPITNQTQCTSCNSSYTWVPFPGTCLNGLTPVTSCNSPAGYVQFNTGTTITPTTNFPIQVQDNSGQTFTINSVGDLQPCTACPTITITTSNQVNVLCNGTSTGSFDVVASGGTAPYDYELLLGASSIATFNNVAGTQSFTGLAAGTYTIDVTDDNGCTETTTITITENPAITISETNNTPATCGSNNGSSTVSASGGAGSFTYSWNTSPVQTGATASGLGAGSYTVTATDGSGCTQTLNVSITSSGGPTVSITSQTNPLCNGGATGTATANATGGTGTINYSWSPTGGSTATGTGLSGGITYTVTATDANGCVGSTTVTLTDPALLTVSTSSTDATCSQSDGTLTAVGSGGTGTISYSWNTSPVQNTATATGVPAGSYTVTATDANGCTATANQSVNNIGAPTISIVSQTDVTCNGDTDGTATVNGTGTGSITYSWNTTPVQTSATATGLSAGTYIVTVTDGSGCTATQSITIGEPAAVTGVASSTPANCAVSDGTASVVASGGDGNYTYSWTGGSTNSTATGLAPGSYTVTITDGNGCTGTATTTVGTVNGANIDAGPDVIISSGSSTTLTATGGVSYVWTPATGLSCTNCASPDASPTTTTVYIVTGTDASGCVGSDTVIVFVDAPCGALWVPTAFSPNSDGSNEELCVYGGCITSLNFQIYDRWGEKVFETTDNSLCWDGVYNGKKMNSAVFVYYLKAILSTGEEVELKGNITLVR